MGDANIEKNRNNFTLPAVLFFTFILFTFLVMNVGKQSVGPEGSIIGFATINRFVFDTLGESSLWYNITDYLGYLAILTALGFGVLGIVQTIKRKSLFKVDFDIIFLGAFYVLVGIAYIFFEKFIVNYRPVILEECLEVSYPSSHTLLIVCIMAAAMI